MSWDQLVATMIGAGVGAFAAAYFGFRYGWYRLKRERAFDRRLEWYERGTTSLVTAANKINWAQAADRIKAPEPVRRQAWSEAHQALAELRGLEVEAEMYASAGAYEAVNEAVRDVSTVAVVALTSVGHAEVPGRLFEICRKLLFHAASRLATDVREHLELEGLPREWRLYDQELRDLRKELVSFEGQPDIAAGR